MRHGSKHRKFGRMNKQRDALIVGLAESLILHSKITTTQAKAKSLRPYVEKLVTKGKTNSVATLRLLTSKVGALSAKKLVQDLGPKFKDQAGGYTRIRNLAPRVSDGSPMAVIEFIK